jgi:hypothetical protein
MLIPHIHKSIMHISPKEICASCDKITFSLPMQQLKLDQDYWFIYWHLMPKELTSIDTKYDMAHKLRHGTFTMVMKAILPQ